VQGMNDNPNTGIVDCVAQMDATHARIILVNLAARSDQTRAAFWEAVADNDLAELAKAVDL